jgi:DtxR family Mn-dependent transcriptional regulator
MKQTPSRSVEDYLKYIYHIQLQGSKVNTSSLAEILNISPASVSEMVGKLSRSGWITNKPYHGFRLTKGGEKISVNLIRKHRLLEVFLQQQLNYKWEEVHGEAERLEHVCSDTFIDKLDEFLGFPKFDPHGDPIPNKNGSFPKIIRSTLAKAAAGKNYIISKVNDTSEEVLIYITRIGIKLNTKIYLSKKLEYDGSVLITIKDKHQLLSGKIAENIFVAEEKPANKK